MSIVIVLMVAWAFILVVVVKDPDTERRGYQPRRLHEPRSTPPYKNEVD